MAEQLRRVSLVTGASGSVGGAVAQRLSARGDALLLHAFRHRERAEAVREEILRAGGAAEVACEDLIDPAAPARLVETAVDSFGRLDVLVAAAGGARDRLLVRMGEEEWEEALALNLTSVWRLAKSAVRHLRRGEHAAIVTVGSSGAWRGTEGQSNYNAAKAGLVGLTRSLARELGPLGIRVNCVAPGFLKSAMTEGLPPERWEAIRAETPLGRFATPEDVAAVANLFSGPDGLAVTGQAVVVDGGRVGFGLG